MSDNYAKYKNALSSKGLHLFPVAGDGNCLFRSVAHQIYGDDALHDLVREKCMDYMEVNSAFFAMFVEGGIENFHRYIAMKRQLTCWGDDPEIQAICEIYGRPAEIWSFDLHQGARRLRTYHEAGTGGEAATISAALRLSFYGGGHYDSIVGPAFNGFLLTTRPGLVEDTSIARARCLIDSGDRPRHSIARFSDTDSLAASDVEATDNAALEMALSTSRKEMEAFGEEDIETCLALSLSCMVAEAKSSSGVSDLSSVPGRKNTESSAAHSMSEGAKYSELDSDEKAVLDLVLKESVNDIKRADELLGPVTEEEIIEAQLLEQVRQESLKQSSGLFSSRSDSKCSSETFTMPASSCRPIPQQDEFEFAIQQSEQEMLEEAIRMSQNVAYGNADVCSASLSGNNQMVSAVDEDEMLRMAIMQSVEMASSPDTRNNDYRTGGGSNCSNNNNDDDDDDDLHRAIAASIQYR